MKRKRYSVEQIIGMLREVEVLLAQGPSVKEVSRELGVTEQTYYRWRKEYEGPKVPQKQPKCGRLWLSDGACVSLRPMYRNRVRADDFLADRTHDGRSIKILTS